MHTEHIAPTPVSAFPVESDDRGRAPARQAPALRPTSLKVRALGAVAAVVFSATTLGAVLALYASPDAPAVMARTASPAHSPAEVVAKAEPMALAMSFDSRWMSTTTPEPGPRSHIPTKPICPRQCI